MVLRKTQVAAIVGMVVSQSAFGAAMTVTGDIYSKSPTVFGTPQGTLYEGVKEAVVKLSSDDDGCRVVYSPNAAVPAGSVSCYVVVNDANLPVGMKFDTGDGRLVGTTAQKGDKSVPYALFYKSGKAATPVQVGSGFLPFRIVPTVAPVITGMASKFDKSTWQDGKEPMIHKRQASGAVKVIVQPRPYAQKIAIDGFSSCTVEEGADNCVALSNSMQNVRGTDDVGSRVMAVDANSSNSYFPPVIDQVALSWDFRPPLVADVVQGNLEEPPATIPTVGGVEKVAFSNIAVTVNSPHKDASDDWWNPASLKMTLAPDLATPRKIYLSYKGRTLLSVASTTHDNSTIGVKPVGNWRKTGPQQFRYDFDMAAIKDGDFLATLEVSDKYGNTSTTESKAIRLDRYAPQVGLFTAELSGVAENEVVFFPERMIVAAHNGYEGGIKTVTAKLGTVNLELAPTDTAGVFNVVKGDYSSLVAGTSYPFVVTATDQSNRVTSKTYMVRYAATDLSLSATPANPVQFVQRSLVKVDTIGYACPLSFDESQAITAAAQNGKITCFAEWRLPRGMSPNVSVLGGLTLEGYIEQEDGIVEYTLFAVSPEGAKMKVKQGSMDLKPKAAAEPGIVFNGRRMQGDSGFMVDNTGGAVGSVIITSSPGELETNIKIPGLLDTKNTVVMRQRSTGELSKTSQVIKVPKGPIWTTYPIQVTAKYARTDKFNTVKEGNIYIVPSKRLKISMSGLDRETVDNDTTKVEVKVGVYDTKTKKVNYLASEHGQWQMRLMQQVTEYKNGSSTRTLIPLTDAITTDANGQANLTFDPSKAKGRTITYMAVGDVISPFPNFNLQVSSSKRHVSLIKGVAVDGTPSVNEIVDRIPMKASVKVKPDTAQDKDALGKIEWQIRDGDAGDWRPAPNATGKLVYTFTTDVPGKWQVRAILHNRMTGVTQPTDITTMVAFDKPEIKLVQKNVVIKGQPVKLQVTGENGVDIAEALNVQWSTDGKTWVDGSTEAEILPVAGSNYIYARAEFADTEAEAERSSWVTAKVMPRTLAPQTIRATVAGPSKAEVQKPFTLKGNYKNDYLLVNGVQFVEEWVLPDGSTVSGNELNYTPEKDGEELNFIYRIWVDGYKDATLKEVKKQVETWKYAFPRFLTSQRQYFRMAPTTIELRNTSLLPNNAPGVTFDFKVDAPKGVKEVSFEKGRYIANITEPGDYSIMVTLTDNRGNSETKEHVFSVDDAIPVQAKITPSYSNKFMRAPLNVTMASSVTLDHPNDSLSQYGWTLDGQEIKEPLRRQLFSGLKAGDHTIVFNAVSEYGQRANIEHNFTVVPNKPAECKLEPTSTASSWRVKMSCIDTDGRVVAYRWKLNGEVISNTSYAISLTKSLNPGVVEIEAVAIDDSGDETTAKTTLTGE
ncbi:TPA: hypothetical protein I8273_004389 [Aeromonas hydrophila]|nr:hypothetical protein [Aeromonas hydrophila]HAT2638855.1 hypothetical protein [Aeromonas hydrophila]HAT3424058.1 hypothetical protein [Aeromonas hydrophila]HAT3534120.1 hypothetical protein [Aeromonas hydrophila]